MVTKFLYKLLVLFLLLNPISLAIADNISDDIDLTAEPATPETVEDLVKEAQELFIQSRSIDARAKLQKAVTVDPNDYRPHMLLGAYYLDEVAHFPLAYRYLETAERLFEEKYHVSSSTSIPSEVVWREHAKLLYLIAEAHLNLDDYLGSLETLDQFAERYWDDWFPGTKAWVLWKLNRTDEAIQVAQAGLLRSASASKTYNILGILLSSKNNRALALEAFSRAIKTELAMGGGGEAATPLNNAGEVYNELFADDFAEAAWNRALTFPDGCEHILPSLNLAILYTNQLQLFRAERVLDDFEACFAQHSLRTDTEHRALLALGRGRIALHKGDINQALELLSSAAERHQWFGKIGTNANDLRFAATISLAKALKASASALNDNQFSSFKDKIKASITKPWLKIRTWWLEKQARKLALTELSDFEDLSIRHTDAMIEYPTLGEIMPGFPKRPLQVRIQRMLKDDNRKQAHAYYQLYLGTNLLYNGAPKKAFELFESAKPSFRQIDRLARAELLAKSLIAQKKTLGFWKSPAKDQMLALIKQREELFRLLPSSFRYHDFLLPVKIQTNIQNKKILNMLKSRFEVVPSEFSEQANLILKITQTESQQITLGLEDLLTKQNLVNVSLIDQDYPGLVNNFIAKVFSHTVDPSSEPLPKLDLLQGLP